jgi:hypothetical protein
MAGAGGNRRSIWLSAVVVALAILGALTPTAAGAATASWAFEPSSYDFGTVMPGAPATAPVAFVLRNTGEVPLTSAFISIDEGEGGEFRFSNGCHATIDPGASCTVDVTFRATATGREESTLEIFENNGAVPPAVVHLSGSGTPGTVSIEPPSLDFGTVTFAESPARRTATLSNPSAVDLKIKEVQFHLLHGAEEPNLPPFGVPEINTCSRGTVVPAGGSCTIAMGFIPRLVGPAAAELRFVDNALDSPQIVQLSGTGADLVIPPPFVSPPPAPEVPAVSLGHHPPSRTRGRSATFTFSGNPAATGFVCSLDHGAFAACTSPVHYASLKPGAHWFQVRATGSDGAQTLGVGDGWRIIKKSVRKKRPRHRRFK